MQARGGVIIGAKYRLERALASGGMGEVWIARHLDLEVDVALKLMTRPREGPTETLLERFRREARCAAKLRHPGVVHVYDYGVEHDTPYIAMELLSGEDLRTLLRREGRQTVARALEILGPVAKLLQAAHDTGLVHRDIKPANVFIARVGDEEVIKVLDFGVVKDLRPELDMTMGADSLVGTPAYMSPEQARGERVDPRSDVWSLGVVLFEIVTGTNPFKSPSIGQVMARIGWEPLPTPSAWFTGVPDGFDDLMAAVLARDRDERVHSADEFLTMLDALVAGRPTVRDPRTERRSSRRGREEATADLEPSASSEGGFRGPHRAPGDWLTQSIRLEKLLGSGSQGEVWMVTDSHRSLPLAAKLFTSVPAGRASAPRFEREARVLESLDNPHIVRFLGHGFSGGTLPFLLMELLPGEDLRRWLQRNGPLQPPEVVRIVSHLCQALRAVHAAGVVHRDVKPANVVRAVGPDMTPCFKLLDFGIARGPLDRDLDLTSTGALVGTPYFISPEQISDPRNVDHRADLWGASIVAYACLTGTVPFRSDNLATLVSAIHEGRFTPPRQLRPDLPSEVDRWMARAFARSIDARFSSAEELSTTFTAAFGSSVCSGPALDPMTTEDGTIAMMTATAVTGPTSTGRRMSCLLIVPAGTLDGTHRARAEQVVRAHGGSIEAHTEGDLVATMPPHRHTDEAVSRAAACGLALWRSAGIHALALVADRVGSAPSAAVARGVASIGDGGGVYLDQTTAALIRGRFEIQTTPTGLRVRRALSANDRPAEVMGCPTPFVGRDQELGQLRALLEASERESVSRAAIIVGEAGMGKSRLVRELASRRRTQTTWTGRADPVQAAKPLGLLVNLAHAAAAALDVEIAGERDARLRRWIEDRLGQTEEADAAFRLLAGPLGSESVAPASPVATDARWRESATQVWLALIRQECARSPLLVVLEDLHWADSASLDVVDSALRALADLPLCVIATGRPELRDRFPSLWRRRAVVEVTLGGISRRGAAELAQSVLGKGEESVDAIVDLAQGNPFFLEELLRGSARQPGVRRAPDSILAILEGRLSALHQEARVALRAGSVFGLRFPAAGAIELTQQREGTFDEALDALISEELIVDVGADRAGRSYAFRHAQVRDAAYAMIEPAALADMHRAAAGWLVGSGERDPAVLASHYERSGDASEAARHYARAARRLFVAGDLAGATSQVDRALVLGGMSGDERAELLHIAAVAASWSGAYDRVVGYADEALSVASAGSPAFFHACAHRLRAGWKQGHRDAVLESAERLLAAPLPTGGGEVLDAFVSSSVTMGIVLGFSGDRERARHLLETALALPDDRAKEPPLTAARRCQGRSFLARLDDDVQGAADWRGRAVDAFLAAGDRREAAHARELVGYSLLCVGLYERALDELNVALSQAMALGADALEATTRQNRALALAGLGRSSEAVDDQKKALEQLEAIGDARMVSYSRAYLARAIVSSNPDEALVYAQDAVATAAGHEAAEAHHRAVLADILLARGDIDKARDQVTRASRTLERLGWISEGAALVRIVLAEVAREMGRPIEMRRVLSEACTDLESRANRLSRPAWRVAFLERVDEHARTLRLARASGVRSELSVGNRSSTQ